MIGHYETTPESYKLDSAIVEVRRGQAQPVLYDLTSAVAWLDVFESLEIPYLTGAMHIVDSAAMSSLINFNGTETIRIALSPLAGPPLELVFNTFSLTNLTKAETNDGVSTYTLQLIEPHGLLSNFRRVRRSLVGNISTIIEGLLRDDLSYEPDPTRFEPSFQSVRVIPPNMTPLGAAQWLRGRATTELGEPFYLYSTLRNGVAFRSLATLLSQNPIDDRAFRYTGTPPAGDRFEQTALQIKTMTIPENDDIIQLARAGAISSRLFAIDPFTREIEFVDFNAADNFAERSELGRTLHKTPPLDLSFTLPDGSGLEVDTAYHSQIVTTQAYGDQLGFDEERDAQRHRTKVASESTNLFLRKQAMDITIPGHHMLSSEADRSVGSIIRLEVPKDQPLYQERSKDAILDKRRSGLWLIARARHRFSVDRRYVAALSLWRPASEDQLQANEERPDYR